MTPPIRWLSAALIALAAGVPVRADEPLPPPTDYVETIDGVTVAASVAGGVTTITTQATGEVWTIPGWHRFVARSSDGRAALILPDEGGLSYSREPGQIVLTFYRPDVAPVPMRLDQFMPPERMVKTVSHYSWLGTMEKQDDGWILTMVDGSAYRISALTGGITPL